MKFTKRAIEGIEATNRRQNFFDDEFTGFALRVSESGNKSFYYTYRPGKGRGIEKKWVMLGSFPTMTVEQAREKCKDMAAKVQQGADPAKEVREEKVAISINDALVQFELEYVSKLKPNTIALYTHIINYHLKQKLGKMRAKDLTYSDVSKFHLALKGTPYMANRCIAVLSVFCNWCELNEYRERASNPCQDILLYKEQKRQEFMDEDVLTVFGETLASMEARWHERRATRTRREHAKEPIDTITPHAAAAIRLLMFTGARLSEIQSLKWRYIDSELGVARLPDSKTGFKALQLPRPALIILENLPQVSEWVFPAVSKSGHMVNLRKAWISVCSMAELSGWRLHDLRHAFASVMVNSGASLPMIGKILGHARASTTQRYAHLQENPARKAAEDAATKIAAITNEPRPEAPSPYSNAHPLQKLRFQAGLSQRQLAERSGVTFQSISIMENGKRIIGKAMAQRLAPALDVDWTLLVTVPKMAEAT